MGLGCTSVIERLLSILGSKLDAPDEKRKEEGKWEGKREEKEGKGREGRDMEERKESLSWNFVKQEKRTMSLSG